MYRSFARLSVIAALSLAGPGCAPEVDESDSYEPVQQQVSAYALGSDPALVAVADAKVSSAYPASNYGSGPSLRVRQASSAHRSYVKFEVGELPAGVRAVRLALFVLDASPDGGALFVVPSTWSEGSISWSNAPALPSSAVGSFGPVSEGTWVEVDVTRVVTGRGTYSFAIASHSSNSAYYSSREGAHAPRLVFSSLSMVDAGSAPSLDAGAPSSDHGATPPPPTPDHGVTPPPPSTDQGVSPPPPPPASTGGIGPISLAYRQGGLWLTPAEILQIPTTNASWSSLVTWAGSPMDIVKDLTWTAGGAGSYDCKSTRAMFARAIVGLRTSNQTMLAQLRAELDRVPEAVRQAIDVQKNDDIKWAQRNLPLIAVSANLIDYRPTALRSALHRAVRVYVFPEGVTVEQAALLHLPNKPAHGRWSLMSTAYLNEDFAAVNAVVKAHAKAMGEPTWGGAKTNHVFKLTGLGSGDNWQTLQPGGKSDPIGIMPAGVSYQGHGVGGLYLADQYRATNGPEWPPTYTNYSYEGLGPHIAVAWSADHLGFRNVFALGNYALLRALLFAYSSHDGKQSWPPSGNDVWQVAAVMTWAKPVFGNTLPDSLKPEPGAAVPWPLPVSASGDPGRSMGFMYATHYARLVR
ncbi:MAG: DNRLRE domain-containing protein [Deltaproteobacteria bacterium]|nr:DNRLRE domain-containing protein [Deltaproteobacteria bacterium]